MISSPSYAQSHPEQHNEYEQDYTHPEHIVVSGTRTPKLLSNSPVSVEVIDKHQLQILTQTTLANALNYIPGVIVTRNVKGGYNIQMQGFDGDHGLVLINSRPIISPTGSATDLDQINVNNIEQIEVLRGAASVMYGSSAMGGVINIITQDIEDNETFIGYEIGHYSDNAISGDEISHSVRLSTSLVKERWAHQLGILYIDNPGFDYDPATINQDNNAIAKHFINLSTEGKSLSLPQINLNKFNTGLKYQYMYEDKTRASSKVPGQNSIISYLSEVKQHQFDWSLNTKVFDESIHKINRNSWQLNSRYISHEEVSGQSNSIRDIDISLMEIDGQYIWSGQDLEVVAGGVIHQDELSQIKPVGKSIEIDDESRESIEGFVQANWIDKNYQLLLGLRAQHDSDFGQHSALRISGMRNFGTKEKPLQWRMGVGQGYRVPNLKERFYEFDHSNLGYMVLGSQDLKPEESTSFNTTLTYSDNSHDSIQFKTELNLHYADTENFIESVIDPIQSTETGLAI